MDWMHDTNHWLFRSITQEQKEMNEAYGLNIVSTDSLKVCSQSSYKHDKSLYNIKKISYVVLNKDVIILLTKRQIECFSLLTLGKTSKEIAKELGISFRTVQEHIQNIKIKANVQYSKELIAIGVKNNLPNYGFYLTENN